MSKYGYLDVFQRVPWSSRFLISSEISPSFCLKFNYDRTAINNLFMQDFFYKLRPCLLGVLKCPGIELLVVSYEVPHWC